MGRTQELAVLHDQRQESTVLTTEFEQVQADSGTLETNARIEYVPIISVTERA